MVVDSWWLLRFLVIGVLACGGCRGREFSVGVGSDGPLVESRSAGPVEGSGAGWLVVEVVRDGVVGGWASGGVIFSDNKIVIETSDVQQFAMHLDMMPIDWGRRVVLRIDGAVFELTRKHFPTIRLVRSGMGSWNSVVDGEGERD